MVCGHGRHHRWAQRVEWDQLMSHPKELQNAQMHRMRCARAHCIRDFIPATENVPETLDSLLCVFNGGSLHTKLIQINS